MMRSLGYALTGAAVLVGAVGLLVQPLTNPVLLGVAVALMLAGAAVLWVVQTREGIS
jgi:hypothetical protein